MINCAERGVSSIQNVISTHSKLSSLRISSPCELWSKFDLLSKVEDTQHVKLDLDFKTHSAKLVLVLPFVSFVDVGGREIPTGTCVHKV